MKGFLGKPDETAAVITDDGWFRTGDMGKVDAEGFVFVEDRLKDMIISGGENIYSPEVERVLAEHPAVMECAIIGVPDDTWGETVKAVVALKPDTSATEDEIIELLPRAPRPLQVPEVRRHHRGAAAQPHGQDPQEGPAEAVLGGSRPRGELVGDLHLDLLAASDVETGQVLVQVQPSVPSPQSMTSASRGSRPSTWSSPGPALTRSPPLTKSRSSPGPPGRRRAPDRADLHARRPTRGGRRSLARRRARPSRGRRAGGRCRGSRRSHRWTRCPRADRGRRCPRCGPGHTQRVRTAAAIRSRT